MTEQSLLRLRNILIYGLIACLNGGAVVAAALLAQGAVPAFEGAGALAPAKPVILAMLGVLVPALTSWLASNRPRVGSEGLAAQVDVLRGRGEHRARMRVLPSSPLATERNMIRHEDCGHDGLMAWVGPTRARGEMLDVLHVRHLDGRRFPAGDNPVCDNCGSEVLYVFSQDGRWIGRSNRPTESAVGRG